MTWVACAERMPEFPKGRTSVECLVALASGEVVAACWVSPVFNKRPTPPRWERYGLLHAVVTHWMPFPAPPSRVG